MTVVCVFHNMLSKVKETSRLASRETVSTVKRLTKTKNELLDVSLQGG